MKLRIRSIRNTSFFPDSDLASQAQFFVSYFSAYEKQACINTSKHDGLLKKRQVVHTDKKERLFPEFRKQTL
ncbi:MAG: hypothetical protein QM654_17435 [Dysgonamonadaceae bacterium]